MEESKPKLAAQFCKAVLFSLRPVKPAFSFKYIKRKTKKVACVSSPHLLPSFIMVNNEEILRNSLKGSFNFRATKFSFLGHVLHLLQVLEEIFFLVV